MIKNLIFDVGEVLLSYRWKQMLMDFGLSEQEAIRIGKKMFDDDENLWHVFDIGIISQEEIIARYCKKYPDDSNAITWFIRHGEYMHVPRPKTWDMLHKLKEKGYGMYLLSNYPEILFKKHTQYADFMNDIDGMIVSYMIHKTKPDIEIYDELCKKYGLNKSECIFFDDRKENVDGAIAYGMKSEQINSETQLLEILENLYKK